MTKADLIARLKAECSRCDEFSRFLLDHRVPLHELRLADDETEEVLARVEDSLLTFDLRLQYAIECLTNQREPAHRL